MNKSDTSLEARKVLVDLWRKMPPEVKFRRVFEAYELGKMLAMAGLRDRHPDASEKSIWYMWAKQHLGSELYEKVYGGPGDE